MKWLGILLLFIILVTSALAITPEEKIYLDGQNQKIMAQISAKIDSQTARIEDNLKTSFNNAKEELRQNMEVEIKNSMMSIAIGLAGLIIITLAVFKVFDMKISATRNIKKYEDYLQKKMKEVDELAKTNVEERAELTKARNELFDYQNNLFEMEKRLQASGYNYTAQRPKPIVPENVVQNKARRRFPFILAILIIVILIILGYIAYRILV